jgi:hypothetical protein
VLREIKWQHEGLAGTRRPYISRFTQHASRFTLHAYFFGFFLAILPKI